MPDDLPPDPFEQHVPEFEDFTGPHADEIRDLIKVYVSAKDDLKALVGQPSLRELGIAVEALDDERARAALLAAISVLRQHYAPDPDQFVAWVEKQ